MTTSTHDINHDPMHLPFRPPPSHEQPDGKNHTPQTRRRLPNNRFVNIQYSSGGGEDLELTQPKFWFTHTSILLLEINVYSIDKPRIELNRDKQANTEREIVESRDTGAFVIRLREYGRDRRQEHWSSF